MRARQYESDHVQLSTPALRERENCHTQKRPCILSQNRRVLYSPPGRLDRQAAAYGRTPRPGTGAYSRLCASSLPAPGLRLCGGSLARSAHGRRISPSALAVSAVSPSVSTGGKRARSLSSLAHSEDSITGMMHSSHTRIAEPPRGPAQRMASVGRGTEQREREREETERDVETDRATGRQTGSRKTD